MRDQGWHDNNEAARDQEEWEHQQRTRRCPRCWTRPLPDVDADTCIPCMTTTERRQWVERRAA